MGMGRRRWWAPRLPPSRATTSGPGPSPNASQQTTCTRCAALVNIFSHHSTPLRAAHWLLHLMSRTHFEPTCCLCCSQLCLSILAKCVLCLTALSKNWHRAPCPLTKGGQGQAVIPVLPMSRSLSQRDSLRHCAWRFRPGRLLGPTSGSPPPPSLLACPSSSMPGRT